MLAALGRTIENQSEVAEQCANVFVHSPGGRMQRWAVPLKLFGYLMVLLMLAAMGYAGFMAIQYWPVISV
ncbi:hypothetical protein LP420_32140 [Massilia sp. B-10]|nr:hypothetical protein LP420_32140 [Massilia sp. B-10]UUZ53380.1 hypothetical protein LP419_31695 [Massilia sp. H-1]